jgi:hypothetical protein
MRRRARRDGHRHQGRTQADWIASLRWNIADAKAALRNAVDMSDWRGVEKYVRQIRTLEGKLARAETHGPRRLARAYREREEMRSRGYKPLGGGKLP